MIKLSHSGITHSKEDCEVGINCSIDALVLNWYVIQLCIVLDALPPAHPVTESFKFDYILLGLLVYELATGKRPFEDIYPLSIVALAQFYNRVHLNIEAAHFLHKQAQVLCHSPLSSCICYYTPPCCRKTLISA